LFEWPLESKKAFSYYVTSNYKGVNVIVALQIEFGFTRKGLRRIWKIGTFRKILKEKDHWNIEKCHKSKNNNQTLSTSSQFHQHFTNSFWADIFFCQNISRQTVIREKLRKALLYEKVASRALFSQDILAHNIAILPWAYLG